MASFCGELQVYIYGKSQNITSMVFSKPQPFTRSRMFHHHPQKASSIHRSSSKEQMRWVKTRAIGRNSVNQDSETEVELESKEEEGEEDLAESYKRLESQIEKVEREEDEKKKKKGKVLVYDPDSFQIAKTGKGAQIADFLRVFGHLLERPYGGGDSVAKAGTVVIAKVSEETKKLLGQEGVKDEVVIEILKFMRLLEMDMELVAAARKDETLLKRLESAHSHCRKAFLIADAI